MCADLRWSTTPPLPLDFIRYRAECGWGEITKEHAIAALAGSVCDVTVYNGGDLAGFGRVVGDGALYYYLQDIIVHPDWRGQGLGGQIVQHLLDQIRARALPGSTIGLMSAAGMERFYAGFGFAARPTDQVGAGMTMVL